MLARARADPWAGCWAPGPSAAPGRLAGPGPAVRTRRGLCPHPRSPHRPDNAGQGDAGGRRSLRRVSRRRPAGPAGAAAEANLLTRCSVPRDRPGLVRAPRRRRSGAFPPRLGAGRSGDGHPGGGRTPRVAERGRGNRRGQRRCPGPPVHRGAGRAAVGKPGVRRAGARAHRGSGGGAPGRQRAGVPIAGRVVARGLQHVPGRRPGHRPASWPTCATASWRCRPIATRRSSPHPSERVPRRRSPRTPPPPFRRPAPAPARRPGR